MRFLSYFTEERVKPWAQENACTLGWITFVNAIGWIVTVLQCH